MSSIYANDWRCPSAGELPSQSPLPHHPPPPSAACKVCQASGFSRCSRKTFVLAFAYRLSPLCLLCLVWLSGNLLWVLSSKPRQTLNIACRQTSTWTLATPRTPKCQQRTQRRRGRKEEREKKKSQTWKLHCTRHNRRTDDFLPHILPPAPPRLDTPSPLPSHFSPCLGSASAKQETTSKPYIKINWHVYGLWRALATCLAGNGRQGGVCVCVYVCV